MKNFSISLIISLIIVLTAVAYFLPNEDFRKVNTEYLRIHIRADSNSESAQNIKYIVKDKVVEYLTPFIAECDTKQKAEKMLKDNLSQIEQVADNVLKEKGFKYTSKASLKNEKFPTRVYDNLTLQSGFYDALIIELGSGKGDNWWCVVYPPLCFVGEGENYIYKSKIYQIINDFIDKRRK